MVLNLPLDEVLRVGREKGYKPVKLASWVSFEIPDQPQHSPKLNLRTGELVIPTATGLEEHTITSVDELRNILRSVGGQEVNKQASADKQIAEKKKAEQDLMNALIYLREYLKKYGCRESYPSD